MLAYHHPQHTLPLQSFPLSLHHHLYHHSPSVYFTSFYKPTSLLSLSALPRPSPELWLAQIPDPTAITPPDDGGPVELPFSSPSIFATMDDPSPIQVATSVLLTGAIGVFLFRALRRRARRAKELKFRSSGAKKTVKEEALDSLKALGSATIDAQKPPTPIQALLGGISAGVIALILYKFTTTIETSLNRQTMSDNLSVRQITITIRTIINGMCYLATFVFGLNSLGLFLYSGQLALSSFMEGSSSEESQGKGTEKSDSQNSASETPNDSAGLNISQGDQHSDNSQ